MVKVQEIIFLFLRLGVMAFGGPVAHIALMQKEIVEQRKWLSEQEFLDYVGITNLIPGPNSTEMASLCGRHRGKLAGLILAGLAFLLPGVLITLLVAWFYKYNGRLPVIGPIMLGFRMAVIGVIASAVLVLGKKALKNWKLAAIGVMVFFAASIGVNPIFLLLVAGLTGVFWFSFWDRFSFYSIVPLMALTGPARFICSAKEIGSGGIFWAFFKVGIMLFGSGYVLISYLQEMMVRKLGLITSAQLVDAIAVGQFTPGPVLSAATFVGFQISGFSGALWATIGIFLPSFLLTGVVHYFIPKLRQSAIFSHFLDAVNVAALGLMAAVLLEMAKGAASNWKSALIAVLCASLVFFVKRFKVWWIMLIGGGLGLILSFI